MTVALHLVGALILLADEARRIVHARSYHRPPRPLSNPRNPHPKGPNHV